MKCGESERRCNKDGCFRMDDDHENTNGDARHGSARVHQCEIAYANGSKRELGANARWEMRQSNQAITKRRR